MTMTMTGIDGRCMVANETKVTEKLKRYNKYFNSKKKIVVVKD